MARRSEDFPAFGAPLFAVADATVVHAEDGQRDHLSRNSLPAFLYLLVFEGVARVLAGARRIVGNHLILDLGNGTYAVYAHLRRGSLTVRAGDRVTAGQRLARCGNSGNSTEPHVHFHLMNGPDLDTARGALHLARRRRPEERGDVRGDTGLGPPGGLTLARDASAADYPRPMPPAKKRTRSYDPVKTRAAVLTQFRHVRDAVEAFTPVQLDGPTRLGEWTVRDLAAHVAWMLDSVPQLLAAPAPAARELALLDWPSRTASAAGRIDAHTRGIDASDLHGLYARVQDEYERRWRARPTSGSCR